MSLDPRPSVRFRTARERAGLSIAEMAKRVGINEPSVWDLETYDDELITVYSAAELQRFASVMSVAPNELLGVESGDSLTPKELASAICEHCRLRGISLDEFGDAVGWDISWVVDTPQMLMTDISIDGIRDVCRELGVDWQRFINGIGHAS